MNENLDNLINFIKLISYAKEGKRCLYRYTDGEIIIQTVKKEKEFIEAEKKKAVLEALDRAMDVSGVYTISSEKGGNFVDIKLYNNIVENVRKIKEEMK